MKIFIILFILILSSCSSFKKKHLKPLAELTLSQDVQDPVSLLTVNEDFFQANKEYILDLYFLLANDAFYQGCLEIAHNGFVFLYQNDPRPGTKEFLIEKFTQIKHILRIRYLQETPEEIAEFNKILGYRCMELKESLE